MSEKKTWVLSIRNDAADETLMYRVDGTEIEARRILMNCILTDADEDESFEDGAKTIGDLTRRNDGGYDGWNRFFENDIHYTIAPMDGLRPC